MLNPGEIRVKFQFSICSFKRDETKLVNLILSVLNTSSRFIAQLFLSYYTFYQVRVQDPCKAWKISGIVQDGSFRESRQNDLKIEAT
jgi:hypothetical protein